MKYLNSRIMWDSELVTVKREVALEVKQKGTETESKWHRTLQIRYERLDSIDRDRCPELSTPIQDPWRSSRKQQERLRKSSRNGPKETFSFLHVKNLIGITFQGENEAFRTWISLRQYPLLVVLNFLQIVQSPFTLNGTQSSMKATYQTPMRISKRSIIVTVWAN